MSAKSNESQPFDFSANPDQHEIVAISNTFWYYTVGNVAMIGFANSYSWHLSEPYFEEACKFIDETKPALVLLQGHWNSGGLGAIDGMDTEHVYTKIQRVPGCDNLGTRLKYVEGHKHCNQIIQKNTGFVLGAFGFEDGDSSCAGAFGLPILDTRNGVAKLNYFELGRYGRRADNFNDIIHCFKTQGYSNCTHYADVWMEEPLSTPS